MDVTIESLREDIIRLRREVELIRHILEENYDLDDKTRRALEEARKTPESEYVDLDEL